MQPIPTPSTDSLIAPAPLREGDEVIILSPSGKIEKALVEGQKKRLESWGLKVRIAPHALQSYHSFAGTAEERLSDLQTALDDPSLRAIFCSRGGYGAVHLLENLDLSRFRENPKWLVGFSDITALHSFLQQQGYQSLHGLMARHIAMEAPDHPQTLRLRQVLFGGDASCTAAPHPFNLTGTAEGILRGGNLSVFYGLRGTPFDLPAPGTILLIEDVGERPYHVERMLYDLRLGGILPRLSGILVGQFTEYTEDRAIGSTLYEMILRMIRPYGYPVAFGFPVGHTPDNTSLPLGRRYKLCVEPDSVCLVNQP